MDLTKTNSGVNRKEFDAAVQIVEAHLRHESEVRAVKEPNLEKRKQLLAYNDMSIKTSRNFCELVNRELYGLRRRMILPEEEKQGRISLTLGPEDLDRIHFHATSWWFWNMDATARVGPFDTSELAAEGLVSYESHRKDMRS